MNNKKLYLFSAFLSIIFLTIISISLVAIIFKSNSPNSHTPEKEYIYIYQDTEETETESEEISYWLVKEYDGRIGVFSHKGILLEVIDVYTKTLPKSDRDELREGIEITDKRELYSIIEAYSD